MTLADWLTRSVFNHRARVRFHDQKSFFYFVVKIHKNFCISTFYADNTRALLFFHENFCKNNSTIVFPPHKKMNAKIFINFDNKIKNDFWSRDRTSTLWVKAEHVSQSAMSQTRKIPWYGTRFEALGELSWLTTFF